MELIGKNLTLMMERAGKDARWISGEVGVHESTVSLWLSGKRTPTVKHLQEVVAALGGEIREAWEGPLATPATPAARTLLNIANNLSPAQIEALTALAKTMES